LDGRFDEPDPSIENVMLGPGLICCGIHRYVHISHGLDQITDSNATFQLSIAYGKMGASPDFDLNEVVTLSLTDNETKTLESGLVVRSSIEKLLERPNEGSRPTGHGRKASHLRCFATRGGAGRINCC